MDKSNIRIRDPFIYPCAEDRTYYLFGTTDVTCWGDGPGMGFDCYKSADLSKWDGPIPAFRPPEGFWGDKQFWAPEVHRYNDRYFMFATFKADKRYRGTQILVSDDASGPYAPYTADPITPPDWECLDGTLHIETDASPWLVFAHEWMQICNGAIYAMPLSRDLKEPAGKPVFLFNASEALWVRRPDWPENGADHLFPTYVTDGPFLHRLQNGSLLMLWSSFGATGYAMGIARSASGHVSGPWIQQDKPLWGKDGGHGMIFRTFDGRLMLTIHQPNNSPDERPVFIDIKESGDDIRIL